MSVEVRLLTRFDFYILLAITVFYIMRLEYPFK